MLLIRIDAAIASRPQKISNVQRTTFADIKIKVLVMTTTASGTEELEDNETAMLRIDLSAALKVDAAFGCTESVVGWEPYAGMTGRSLKTT